ncbi:uncharacterized protein N7496_000793 [Penicillium cataractarum]|uniref:Uncharacterized protein n=1 Tax=Penicillium cataractarum TaxID=2100454 RepID=A0A9W9VV17_9EURO|nr:uncharacterized protein N7496_000793 [Penicillium cataractarum]KAJ5389725.1 hypothetical protein N7496_000793 [Penicillium cataractarum]
MATTSPPCSGDCGGAVAFAEELMQSPSRGSDISAFISSAPVSDPSQSIIAFLSESLVLDCCLMVRSRVGIPTHSADDSENFDSEGRSIAGSIGLQHRSYTGRPQKYIEP